MKIDLLLKKFEDYSQDKAQMQTLQALETRMTCEVCGNIVHSGDNCPETQEEALFLNGNGFRPQGGQGWNQPCPYYQGGNGNSNYFGPNQPILRDLVYGQAKINESLQNKLAAIDKSMETIHAKMDGFSTAIKNQFSFNKMIETQLAQVAATMPPALENVKAITTRGGKTTQDPPYPNHVNRKKASPVAEEPPREEEPEKVHEGKTAPHESYDTQGLPFPMRARKPSTDEQFNHFVEIIQQVNINVPLMDAMKVPTYARYIKDIINNKRPLPTTEVIKLTKACSTATLQQLPKKKDPGFPTI